MEAIDNSRRKTKRVSLKDMIIPCPLCDRTNTVNTVASWPENAKYCKECKVEFSKDRELIPPLY